MKILKKISQILFWFILIVIATYSASTILAKVIWKDKTPSFFGYKNFIVLTGSMKPVINEGDIVFVKETNEINEDDIISFKVENSVVTHRVVDIKYIEGEKVFLTKGDNNTGIDNELIKEKDIEGKFSFKIPFIGKVILFLRTKTGLFTLLILLGIALFINTMRTDEEDVLNKEDKKDSKVKEDNILKSKEIEQNNNNTNKIEKVVKEQDLPKPEESNNKVNSNAKGNNPSKPKVSKQNNSNNKSKTNSNTKGNNKSNAKVIEKNN